MTNRYSYLSVLSTLRDKMKIDIFFNHFELTYNVFIRFLTVLDLKNSRQRMDWLRMVTEQSKVQFL